jgi:hypothetical protein
MEVINKPRPKPVSIDPTDAKDETFNPTKVKVDQ